MKLDYKKTFILGFGFFAISLIWQIYNFYIPLFLWDFLPNQMTKINGIMTIDNILAVTMIPFIGSLSDRTKTRFGRRMPFLIIGMPLSAIVFIILPYLTKANGGNLILFMAAEMVFLVAMALYRSPTIALMPDITPAPLRSKANGIINFMGGLGTILALTVGAKLFKINEPLPFLVTAITVIVSLLILLKWIKEPEIGSVGSGDEEKINLRSSIQNILHNTDRTTLYILLAIFFWFVAYHGVVATFSNYCVKFLGLDSGRSSFYLSVMSGVFMLLAIPSGYLAAKYSKRNVISLGLVGMLIAFCLIALLRPELTLLGMTFNTALIALMAFAGVSWSLININSYPLVVELTTEDKIGTYTGLYYFASQVAAIFGPLFLGIIIDLFGFWVMFPATALGFAIAFVFIRLSRPVEKQF